MLIVGAVICQDDGDAKQPDERGKHAWPNVVNVHSIFALPGLLMAPRLSIAGLVAAPLLGFKVHLENEDGKEVDVEGAVRKAAETVKETVTTASRTIKEEIDKAWEAVSADDPEPNDESADEGEEAQEDAEETEKSEEDKKSDKDKDGDSDG